LHIAIDRATAQDLEKIEATLDPFERLQKQKRTAQADVYDIRFHQLLLKASRNEYLMGLHEVITRYFVRVHKEYPGTAQSTNWERTREHRIVFKAMQCGDHAKATGALRSHLVDFELKA
jgi:DNA-binding FadR family transcriptional regulator